jgi:anti-sigma factor RsiW
MNEDHRMPEPHPEAELASFVDGSATDRERGLVEAHLAGCSTCRADVEFAMQGRAAMRALPQLESPGLTDKGLAWLPQARPDPSTRERSGDSAHRTRDRSKSRIPGWQRVAWGSGIAVAATIVAVFVFANLQGGGSLNTTAGGTRVAESGAEAVAGVQSSTDYDRASLAALAQNLLQQGKSFSTDAAAPAAAPIMGATPSVETLEKDAATRAQDCLQRAAGVADGETPSYVEVATFQGTPAFIGAFHTSPSGGTLTQLLVVAVSRADCRVLYLVTLPL